MASIDIIDSAGNTYRYDLPADGSMLLIGSGEDCSISLPHITDLLPQHCSITLQDEGFVIAVATPDAVLLAENQLTEAAVLVPGAVYNIGSSTLMFDDGAAAEAPAQEAPPVQEAAPAQAEAAPAPLKKKKKRPAPTLAGSPVRATTARTEEDSAMHIILRRLYVIAILALSFLAGLTMRYWMVTGDFLIDELLK